MKFYLVKGPLLWGDYGSILASGISRRGSSDSDPFLLFRTGPFIPPISFPHRHVVVSDDFRQLVDSSGLFTFEYRSVVKQHIAKLHWERWDRSAPDPQFLPRGGEPESYILNRWHSWLAARAMGKIWELILPEGAETESHRKKGERKKGEPGMHVMVNGATWSGAHFFRSKNQGWKIASEVGCEWLRKHAAEWTTLHPCIAWDDRFAYYQPNENS